MEPDVDQVSIATLNDIFCYNLQITQIVTDRNMHNKLLSTRAFDLIVLNLEDVLKTSLSPDTTHGAVVSLYYTVTRDFRSH